MAARCWRARPGSQFLAKLSLVRLTRRAGLRQGPPPPAGGSAPKSIADDAPLPQSSSFVVSRGAGPLPSALAAPVVAIGNFDGMHAGHRAVLEAARRLAAEGGRPAAALTFEPHPRSFFAPQTPVFRLTPEPVKAALFEKLGLNGMVVLAFDAALAATSAADFVDRLLGKRLGVSGIVVGHDFHFGKGRAGSPALLVERGDELGLAVVIVPSVTYGDQPVSSTLIRAALEAGDVERANRLLGYRWFVRATVRHGDKRGRSLGYPTANLRLGDGCRLAHGIYAVRCAIDGAIRDGVASYGRRPTFGEGEALLEAFLFEFDGDLYGREIDVEFLGFIRGEERFVSAGALMAKMDDDSARAKAMLAASRGASAPSMIG